MPGAVVAWWNWLAVGVVVVLLVLSALLAAAETSLTRTSRVKARALHEQNRRGSRRLVALVEHPEQFLNPVLLMVLICQLVSATLVGVLAERWFGGLGVAVGTIFEVVVIFVLAEALPKNWAVSDPEEAALFSAPFVSAVVGFPLVRLISAGLNGLAKVAIAAFLPSRSRAGGKGGGDVSELELLAMADVAMADEVIETEEHAFIHSIIEFGDTVVREVMVPRPDMVVIEAGTSVSGALEAAIAAGFSRLPVYERNLDDVVGIAYAKDLIRVERAGHGGDAVREHVRPAHFVPETKRVSGLMSEMQRDKYHQVVVVDEYGGTSGLVTLEDLIEELVGEIVDEYDVEEPDVERLPSGALRVNGRMVVGEVNELLHADPLLAERFTTDLPTGSWDTVGGLMLDLLGHVPVEGEAVVTGEIELTADRVQGRRIRLVRISPVAGPGAPGSEQGERADRGGRGGQGA